jgi:hypothetical protein
MIAGSVGEVLGQSEITLRRLNRGMAERQLEDAARPAASSAVR